MNYYQFSFDVIEADEKDLLIARLADAGFEGFEEEGTLLKAFVSEADFKENEFESIIEQNSLKYLKSVIQETNWNAKWESGFEPVSVFYPGSSQPFARLRAAFHPADQSAEYDLLITPKMSFGTGHHATTYLMIEQMSQLSLAGKSVIDFGTGTGVLAILAEKLGAAKIIAIDYDDWSINNAQENVEANQCTRIILDKADTIPPGHKADIILANINLNIILANIDAIKTAANPGADILFSGILAQDEETIIQALNQHGFRINSILKKDNWLAIVTTNG